MEHILLRVPVTMFDMPGFQALFLALLVSGIGYVIYNGREKSI